MSQPDLPVVTRGKWAAASALGSDGFSKGRNRVISEYAPTPAAAARPSMAASAGRLNGLSGVGGVTRGANACPPAVTASTGAQARWRYHGTLVVMMVLPGCQFAGGSHPQRRHGPLHRVVGSRGDRGDDLHVDRPRPLVRVPAPPKRSGSSCAATWCCPRGRSRSSGACRQRRHRVDIAVEQQRSCQQPRRR